MLAKALRRSIVLRHASRLKRILEAFAGASDSWKVDPETVVAARLQNFHQDRSWGMVSRYSKGCTCVSRCAPALMTGGPVLRNLASATILQ